LNGFKLASNKDTAKEIVAAMGGKADAKTITAAVTARMKG
jgi:F-type H+-transporting ATPase subunit b